MAQADARLAAALAGGLSQEAAGAACGVSRSSVTRALRNPAFRALVDELRAAHARRIAERLATLADRACEALEQVLAAGESDAARVSAARAVLANGLAYSEAGDLERRIAELEARLGAGSNGDRRVRRHEPPRRAGAR